MRNETDSIPDIFLYVLTPASRIHNHNTRFVSSLNYFRSRVSTNLGKTSYKFSAPKIWVTVPPGLNSPGHIQNWIYDFLSSDWFTQNQNIA